MTKLVLCAFSSAALALALGAAACGPSKTVASPIDIADPSVARGKELYTANCNKCHGYADPHAIAENKWPEIIDEMGEKAKLAPPDRQAVLQYVLAAKKQ